MLFWVMLFVVMGALGVSHDCNKGRPSEDEWRKMKNAIERLDENVDRLNKKCGVDPTKATP